MHMRRDSLKKTFYLKTLSKDKVYQSSVKVFSFLPSLIISYVAIIIICILSMALLSFKFIGNNINNQSIKSSNKLVNQFKGTVDNLLLGNINELSIKILQDSKTNPFISYYFNNTFENNMYDMVNVSNYLNTMKSVNPMLFSIGIFFEYTNLLISTEFIRYAQDNSINTQSDLLYYKNLVTTPDNVTWHVNHNYNFVSFPEKTNYSIIQMVRKVNNVSNSNNKGGSIIITISEDVFYNLIKKSAPEDFDKIIIIDGQGTIVSHTDKEYLGRNINEESFGTKITASSQRSEFFISDFNEVKSVISFSSSEYNDWKFITVMPIEKYSSAAEFLINAIILIALFSILLGVLISIIIAYRLSNPFVKIATLCKGILNNSYNNEKNESYIIHSTIKNLTSSMKENENKIKEFLPILRINFIQNILTNVNLDVQEIAEKSNFLSINMPHKNFCALIVKAKKNYSSYEMVTFEYEKIDVISHLENTFNTNQSIILHYERENNVEALINCNIDYNLLCEMVESFLRSRDKWQQINVYVSIGELVDDISLVNKSYTSALLALNYSYIYPERHFITSANAIIWDQNSTQINRLLLSNFSNSIKKLSRNDTLDDLNLLFQSINDNELSYDHVIKTLSACASIIETAKLRSGTQKSSIPGLDIDLEKQLKKANDIIEYKDCLQTNINILFDNIEGMHNEKNNKNIEKVKSYIYNNIRDNQLSLNSVAEALCISSSYLSHVFKNETGTTFIEYLTSMKLEYCKDLLLNTNKKIDEISSLMGYSSSQYFISRFKMKFGSTPKEYRKLSKNVL